MANSKAPKHDFAPAWLKIPEQDNHKSVGVRSGEHADKSGRNSNSRRDDYHHHPPPSEYYNRRVPAGKLRHGPPGHEEEYYGGPPPHGGYGGYGFYNGHYPGSDKHQYRAQYRAQYRDKQHNTRYPPPMNGGYSSYYDSHMYDYYADEGSGYYNNGYSRGGSKRSYGGDRHNTRDKTHDPDTRSKDDALGEDFPSLNGDTEPENKAGKPINNTVWDGKPKISSGKTHNNQIFKALQTSKSGTPKKILKSSSEMSSLKSTPTELLKKDSVKEGSPTPPIFVTQPKTLTNKKSEFLKAMRRHDNPEDEPDLIDCKEEACLGVTEEVHRNGRDVEDEGKEGLVNGVHGLSLTSSPHHNILSSSLEAEQRLLREMGWNEMDDDMCELTEEERREMDKLSQEIKLRKQERNGVKKVTPKMFSPQHVMFSPSVAPHHSSDSSSSDSDLD